MPTLAIAIAGNPCGLVGSFNKKVSVTISMLTKSALLINHTAAKTGLLPPNGKPKSFLTMGKLAESSV